MAEMDLKDAYAKAWASIKQPDLDGSNPHFKSRYATLAGTQARIREACAANGIAYRQRIALTENGSVLVSEVVGMGDEMHLSEYPIQFVPNPQSNGSMLTYAKRQLCCIDWGICGEEDDDGNAAAQKQKQDALEAAKTRLWRAAKVYAGKHGADPNKVLEGCWKRPDATEDAKSDAAWMCRVAAELEAGA